jgi:hypothetical protein
MRSYHLGGTDKDLISATRCGRSKFKSQSKVRQWKRPGFYRGFTAVGRTLADVKEFAALVRWYERIGKLERLSEMHPPGWEKRMQTTWGGNWFPHRGLTASSPR